MTIPDATRPFFYNIEDIKARSTTEAADEFGFDEEEREKHFEAFGRNLYSKRILASPSLSVFYVKIGPGERTAIHRHGTNQITFVIKGELRYGNRVTGPGMGYYNPNRWYAWTAGPEGAEIIEIHSGIPGVELKDGSLEADAPNGEPMAT